MLLKKKMKTVTLQMIQWRMTLMMETKNNNLIRTMKMRKKKMKKEKERQRSQKKRKKKKLKSKFQKKRASFKIKKYRLSRLLMI